MWKLHKPFENKLDNRPKTKLLLTVLYFLSPLVKNYEAHVSKRETQFAQG